MSDRNDTTGDAPWKESLSKGLGKQWNSLVRRGGNVVDRLTDTVKEVGRAGLLKQALDARERGNLAAAFWLLEEEYRAAPEEAEVATHFWDVAVAYQRPLDAVEAVTWLIRRHSTGAGMELAVQYWSELVGLVPDALADPTVLTRLIPVLQQKEQEEENEEVRELRHYVLIKAIRAVVNRHNQGLSSGVAMHVAEMVRELDPASALAAAHIALESHDLHEAKRGRLLDLVAELSSDAPPLPPEKQNEAHPAYAHPLREHSPHQPGLSEEEIQAMKAKLPPSVATTAVSPPPEEQTTAPLPAEVAAAPDVPAPALDTTSEALPELEIDPDMESHPEIETDPEMESHPDIEFEVECEPAPNAIASEAPEVEVAVETTSSPVEPSAHDVVVELAEEPAAPETTLSVPVEDPRFSDLKTMDGDLCALDEDGVSIAVAGGRTARVTYEMIEAIAIAELPGDDRDGVLVIDLLLNWNANDDGPLRAIRLLAEGFETNALSASTEEASMELRDAVAEILDKSQASPLPDPDSVLGLSVQRFESVEAYERNILQVAR